MAPWGRMEIAPPIMAHGPALTTTEKTKAQRLKRALKEHPIRSD